MIVLLKRRLQGGKKKSGHGDPIRPKYARKERSVFKGGEHLIEARAPGRTRKNKARGEREEG